MWRTSHRSTLHPIRCGTAAVIAAIIGLLLPAGAQAAAWQGGDGPWVSDNWGLDGPDGSPGDANYPAETADIDNPGQILIHSGDVITQGANVNMWAGNAIVVQHGGVFTLSHTIFMREQWTLNGGMLTGAGTVRLYDATLTVHGGQLGDRDEVSAHNWGIEFRSGSALLDIYGGKIAPHNIKMDQGASSAWLRIHGADAELKSVVTSVLAPSADRSATVEFIFSSAGISTYTQQGGSTPHLTLSTVDGAADLVANVSAYRTVGEESFTLFDYGDGKLSGTFGSVTITDTYYGTLTPGTIGSLERGQYALDYTGGDGSDIVLHFNTSRPPRGTTILFQ